ncbi:1-phosphatidylinositol phosphodiesterase [Tritrichomonas foetus]|uniref:1-phosphatidylinositol phosphodiesterase n=1 Tax=Tritrichomonas foetus TaxID=1144522 RepID=A0A1J4KR12_9EUKA|nr:1-phosphatidylinositol phosphodiesterase [Tritrichomonas foetus]|eukprot:OHT13695.1 1-phosphatidylinositol phosphodiesterase [Tritrichomonas foetus]
MCILFFLISQAFSTDLNDIKDPMVINELVTVYRYYPYSEEIPENPSSSSKYPIHIDWMANLDNSKRLSELSIPGTHETCARHGGALTECQSLSLMDQLKAGIRFIDIRCRHINDVFTIHHGKVYQQINFGGGVRDVCIEFLKENPTEFILMLVKPEHTEKDCTRSFCETMQTYINYNEDYFYLNEGNPKVEDVRGKIVLIRRFQSDINPMGNDISFVDNAIFTSTTSIVARVQDCYHVNTLFDREKKWGHVKQILEESREDKDKNTFYLNYGSGASSGCYPYSVAEYTTPKIGSYLKESLEEKVHCGVLLVDFFEKYFDDLVYYIIERNY